MEAWMMQQEQRAACQLGMSIQRAVKLCSVASMADASSTRMHHAALTDSMTSLESGQAGEHCRIEYPSSRQ